MIREERLELIENFVNFQKHVKYVEIMEKLNISKATARRDLELLDSENRLTLVRGGAISCNNGNTNAFELPYMQKQTKSKTEKSRIANAAIELVRPGNTIILDAGTTTRELIAHLAQCPNLQVITCDIAIAADCSYYSNIDVTVIGGRLRNGYYNLTGFFTEEMLKTLRADIAFVSIDAVNTAGICKITNIEEVTVKRLLLNSANQSVLLCDHTKFGCDAVVKVCHLNDYDMIITGKELDNEKLPMLEELGSKLKRV